MSPLTIDLVFTITASLLVLAAGVGAVLVLPWGETDSTPLPSPEPSRAELLPCPWVEAT